MNKFNEIGNLLRDFGKRNGRINHYNHAQLEEIINMENARYLMECVLQNPDLLKTIASQSYPHGLGQDKILLFPATAKTSDMELRWHFWPPSEKIDVEGRHHHNWEGYSLVMNGMQEEHQFALKSAETDEQRLYEKVENIHQEIITQMDILEILYHFPDSRISDLSYKRDELEEILIEKLQIENIDTLKKLLPLHIIYGNQMNIDTGKEVFQKQDGIWNVEPINMRKINKGESYYLPEGVPHRVLPDQASTFIVTSVNSNQNAPRWTAYKNELNIASNTMKQRNFFSPSELEERLEKALSFFE